MKNLINKINVYFDTEEKEEMNIYKEIQKGFCVYEDANYPFKANIVRKEDSEEFLREKFEDGCAMHPLKNIPIKEEGRRWDHILIKRNSKGILIAEEVFLE